VLVDQVVQAMARDPEPPGRPRDVPARLAERIEHSLSLGLCDLGVERASSACRRPLVDRPLPGLRRPIRPARPRAEPRHRGRDDRAVDQERDALDGVAELADVARPRVGT